MSKVNVAIIDNGINQSVLMKNGIDCKSFRVKNNKIIIDKRLEFKKLTHGSKCASVFVKYAQNYNLYSLKIMNGWETKINNLKCAIDWCSINNIDLISLSIGSTNPSDFYVIEKSISNFTNRGGIIVAAGSNNNRITYPASQRNVFGVRWDSTNNLREEEFFFNDNDTLFLQVTSGCPTSYFAEFNIKKCNSYATAYIAAIICNIMSEGIREYPLICRRLLEKSTNKAKYLSNGDRYSGALCYGDKNEAFIICVNNISKQIILELYDIFRKNGYSTIVITNDWKSDKQFIYAVNEIRHSDIELLNPDIIITTNLECNAVDCSIGINKENNKTWLNGDYIACDNVNSNIIYQEIIKHYCH